MNRNDERDIYRSGANGIGGTGGTRERDRERESSSFDEDRFDRDRERLRGGYGSSMGGQQGGYGGSMGQGGYGRGLSGGQSGYSQGGYGRSGYGEEGGGFGGRQGGYGQIDYGRGQYGQGQGVGMYGGGSSFGRDEDLYSHRDREHGWGNREYERSTFRGRDENLDFWGRPRHHGEERSLGERIGDFFRGDDRVERNYYQQQQHQQWGRPRHEEPGLWDKVKGAFTGKGPKGYARSDERVKEDVCERLTYHPYIDASDVEVQVKDGEVTLTGLVDDRQAKRLAEDIVEDIRGVRDVHNQIRVRAQAPLGGLGSSQTSGTSTTSSIGTSGGNKR